jgi:hypothetical protein
MLPLYVSQTRGVVSWRRNMSHFVLRERQRRHTNTTSTSIYVVYLLYTVYTTMDHYGPGISLKPTSDLLAFRRMLRGTSVRRYRRNERACTQRVWLASERPSSGPTSPWTSSVPSAVSHAYPMCNTRSTFQTSRCNIPFVLNYKSF